MKVLAIDDDPADLAIIARILEPLREHTATLVSDGPGGLLRAQEDPPDLLLLDWLMPGLSGIDILMRLKSRPQRRMPAYVVMTTAAPDIDLLAVIARQHGADEIIPKPLTESIVDGIVTRAAKALMPKA